MGNLYAPSYLKELCTQYHLSPSKQYGQNYLISEKPILAMLEAADLSTDDTVVEVGPGFGVLTLPLAEKVGRLISFEIEKKLAAYWEATAPTNMELLWGNALHQFKSDKLGVKQYKVVANLPYQVTSALLRLFLEADHKPEKIVVMVQKEVAERICAKPGDLSLLAVSVQLFGTPRIVTKVPKGSFWPAPKVDSAVLAIDVHEVQPSKEEGEAVFRVVKAAFQNKRKQAAKNIAAGLALEETGVRSVLAELTGNEKIRAQAVSIDQWKAIAAQLC